MRSLPRLLPQPSKQNQSAGLRCAQASLLRIV
jgi:hypothetical protein